MSRAGYVLVGGRSSRMGRDKALLPFHGGALAQFVAGAVEEAAGSAVLVGDLDRYQGLGYPVIPDLHPGEGPLGGILTSLRHTQADWNLIIACDMPGLSADFLRWILEMAEPSAADAVLPVGPAGMPEPLCAAYHRRALLPLENAFLHGERKIMAALHNVRTITLPTVETRPLQNVNTPEDWAEHAGS